MTGRWLTFRPVLGSCSHFPGPVLALKVGVLLHHGALSRSRGRPVRVLSRRTGGRWAGGSLAEVRWAGDRLAWGSLAWVRWAGDRLARGSLAWVRWADLHY